MALLAEGPKQARDLGSGGGDAPDRLSNGSGALLGEYRRKSCGIAREATQAVAAVACGGKEAPASAVAAVRNRESTGQGAVGEQSRNPGHDQAGCLAAIVATGQANRTRCPRTSPA